MIVAGVTIARQIGGSRVTGVLHKESSLWSFSLIAKVPLFSSELYCGSEGTKGNSQRQIVDNDSDNGRDKRKGL